ncbi:MAG: hypothetical protein ACI88H_001297 [Cocleimonas sp.]|jgi:hypothetical protein
MSIVNFKNEIESILLITDWSPSESDLYEISEKIKVSSSALTKQKLEEIVYSVVGSFEQMILGGVDNSDLTTILMMATKVENK